MGSLLSSDPEPPATIRYTSTHPIFGTTRSQPYSTYGIRSSQPDSTYRTTSSQQQSTIGIRSSQPFSTYRTDSTYRTTSSQQQSTIGIKSSQPFSTCTTTSSQQQSTIGIRSSQSFSTYSIQQNLLEQQRRQSMRILPVSDRPLRRTALQNSFTEDWDPMPANVSFLKIDVQPNTEEYDDVVHCFKTTTQKKFRVVRIERIQNPYTLGCFLLKKEEMQNRFGYVEEKIVFHGTSESNVQSICTNNFDWRLHGDSTGNKFGKGVSFSPISYYASYYSDEHCPEKVMFLVKVLVSKTVVGNGDMVIPPSPYDTAGKENGHVLVKFSDNEFYPEYLIHYTGTPFKRGRRYKTFVDYDDY